MCMIWDRSWANRSSCAGSPVAAASHSSTFAARSNGSTSATWSVTKLSDVSIDPLMIRRSPLEDLDRVGEDLQDGAQRLARALRAARQVHDQGPAAHAGDGAGQHRPGRVPEPF